MKRAREAVLILLAGLAACASAGAKGPDPQLEWLRANAQRVEVESGSFADLEFLRPLVAGKRIVQLGENTHGAREYNLVKSRIARFLHGELGFDLLVFESALYQCHEADRTAGTVTAVATLTGCAYGVWHTREVLPLFEYLRATRQGERPLRLAGMDIQPIGPNKAERPRFLADAVGWDAAYAAEVFALDSTFLEVYARGGRERRAYFRSEEGRRMAAAYDVLAGRLMGSGTNGGGAEASVARQTALSMARYIRQQASPTTREYVERRDGGMADNLVFLLEELYPASRAIVWGHNYHLRHDNAAIAPDTSMFPDVAARTAGSWIRERYGSEVYTIGVYAYGGSAADNGGDVFAIPPAAEGSLEALLRALGPGVWFVDLSRAPAGEATAWIDRPITARYDGTTPLTMVPREQYDAVLVFGEVTPRVMLY